MIRHLAPYFSGRKIREVRRNHVEAFRAHLLDKGIETRTVNKCLTLLGQMCRYAIRHGWLETNLAEGTKLRASSRRGHDLIETCLDQWFVRSVVFADHRDVCTRTVPGF
ncbi:MAG: phage integrase SAM-like domain-containing protein [Gammaproteobacteria bacterium]